MNGVRLHVKTVGEGPPLLLLHGFTGSAESWHSIEPILAASFRLIQIDVIGHGASDAPQDPKRYSMEHAVRDLLGLLDRLNVPRAAVLGYSMGGRLALQLAVKAPERMSALILESATYGIEADAERAQRAASDAALADWIEEHGVAAFAERWASNPLFSTQSAISDETRARQRRERTIHTPHGLANSLRGMGTGSQSSLRSRLSTLRVPTLIVAGALDAKFSGIAQEMHALLPCSKLALVTAAGHNVHLESPAAFADAVVNFLTKTDREEVDT